MIGGVGPFTWTMATPGSAFTEGTTLGKTNTLTCTTVPSTGNVGFSVTDSCGVTIQGEITPVDYSPGEGCTTD